MKVFFYEIFVNAIILLFLCPELLNKFRLSDGVTGNTTDFGSVESRFEP
jgi:hypothetical protein